MASSISVQPALATLTPADHEDLESNFSASAKASTTTVDEIPDPGHERDSIVREGRGGTDTAAQVVASVWTRNHLITAYAFIWFAVGVCSLFENVLNALGPWVASAFNLHSYAAATGIVASVVGGLSPVPTAKLLQKIGRAQGLLVMLLILVVGLVMLAACQNVSTYAAAQVFTSVGSAGLTYCVSVFVADTTSLRNRGFMTSFSTSPDIVTMWLGGPMASNLLTGIGWRWGFGISAIAIPVALMPLIGLIYWNQRKAIRSGLLLKHDTNKIKKPDTVTSILKRFVIQVDLAGLLMLATGISLFLLAFTLYSFQHYGFDSPLIISFIAIGLSLIIGYALYERYLAPTTSLPFAVLCDRTVILALLTITLTIIAFTNIIGYGTSWLQVVTNLSITQTSYLVSSIKVIICIWSLFIGALIRWTGRLKLLTLTLGIPLMIAAAALFLNFRHFSHNDLGLMIGVVVLISLSIGTISLCAMLIMMAALGQDHNTTVIACFTFLTNVAPAVGEAVNTGIWTGVFKQALHRHLPSLTAEEIKEIYSNLGVQLSFPEGSVVREGIALAYGDAKFYMLITSLCLMAVTMVTTLFWRDLRTTEVKAPSVLEVGGAARRESQIGG